MVELALAIMLLLSVSWNIYLTHANYLLQCKLSDLENDLSDNQG